MNTKETILFIEDEFEIRKNVEEMLTLNGYNVISMDNGNNAFEIASQLLPDLVLCDIMLPGLDGFQICSLFQQNVKTGIIPFIFLSAKSDEMDLRKGMNLGADDYISKPFKMEDLLKSVNVRLKKERMRRTYSDLQSSPEKKKIYSPESSIYINWKDSSSIIKIKDIIAIKAEDKYSNLYLANDKKYFFSKSLKYWEENLPENLFIRIHRSSIINLDKISSIESFYKNSFKMKLEGIVEEFFISERYARKIKKEKHILQEII